MKPVLSSTGALRLEDVKGRVLMLQIANKSMLMDTQAGPAAWGGGGGATLKLRILETTDLHVNVLPYDYYRDKPDDTVGLARTATLIKAARAEAQEQPAVRQWRPDAGQPDGRLRRLKPHEGRRRPPVLRCMNTLDYAAANAGQPRVQLRPVLPAAFRWPARTSRSSAPTSSTGATPARRWPSSPIDLRRGGHGRSRRQHRLQDRRHRLRAAADHAVGPGPSRRQGDDARHRRAAQRHVPEMQAASATSCWRSAIPASRAASARAARRTPRCIWRRCRASTPSSPGTAQGVPGQGLRGHPRRRRRGNAARRAGRHGRLLGQPSRHHRPRPRQDRRRLAGGRRPHRGPPDLRAQPTARPWCDADPPVAAAVKADHEARSPMCAARWRDQEPDQPSSRW